MSDKQRQSALKAVRVVALIASAVAFVACMLGLIIGPTWVVPITAVECLLLLGAYVHAGRMVA